MVAIMVVVWLSDSSGCGGGDGYGLVMAVGWCGLVMVAAVVVVVMWLNDGGGCGSGGDVA